MLLLVTILLVVVAAVMLVIGFVSSSLTPIYVSIACSALAAIVLLVFSRLSKRDAVPASAGGPSPLPGPTPVTASAAGGGAGAATTTAVLDRPVTTEPAPPGEGVTVLPAGDTGTDGSGDAAAAGVGAAAVAESDDATAQYAPVGTEEAASEFPIEDYDELKVSDILPLLPELDADELAEVRQREQQGKGRATVLNRIDVLMAGASSAVAAVPAATEAASESAVDAEPGEPETFGEPEALGEPASEIASTDLEAAVEEQPPLDEVSAETAAGPEAETVAVDVGDEPVAVPGSQPVSEPETDLVPVGAAADGSADDDDFPIADYDDLKVSEILPLLSQLEPEEIPVVRAREQGTKARGTILNRLDQVARGNARGQAVSDEPEPEPAPTASAAPAKKSTARKSTTKKAAAAKATTKKAAAPGKTSAKKAAAPAKKSSRSTKK